MPSGTRSRAGAWYVGICLGLQLLFERSDEDGAAMLGLLEGDVVAIADAPRLPHIGWNQLEPVGAHPLLAGVADGAPAYFVHSYVAGPPTSRSWSARRSTARASRAHRVRSAASASAPPERSGDDGLRLLRNMLAVTGRASAAPVGAA